MRCIIIRVMKTKHNKFFLKKIAKLTLVIFVFIVFFSFQNIKTSHATTVVTSLQYARITRSNIAFYDIPSITDGNVMFYPEISYFVQILQPEQDNFYKVKYKEVEGYILSSDLVFVSGQPKNPYPEQIGVKILANGGLNLRSSPSTSGPFNILQTLPFLESNIEYLGIVHGEEYVPNMGDIWYYCRYFDNQENIYGYLYAVYCYPIGAIMPNTEEFEIVDKPYFPEETVQTQTNSDVLSTLPKQAQIVIIFLVCLPCILIVYLLFKPTKLAVDVGKNKKKKIKRLKKSDYYEFDE